MNGYKLSFFISAKDGGAVGLLTDRGTAGPEISFRVTGDSAHVRISECQQDRVVVLAAHGGPTLGIHGPDGKSGITMGAFGDFPHISLMGKGGSVKSHWMVLPGGGPALSLNNDKGQDRFMAAIIDGTPILTLKGKDGVVRTNWAVAADGAAAINFSDEKGQSKSGMSIDRDGKPGGLRPGP